MKTIFRALALLLLATSARAFFIEPAEYMSEYANAFTGHYVLLDSGEAASVQGGSAGPGWEATGYSFEVVSPAHSLPAQQPVCRFYSPRSNSHFFTGDPAECEFLKTHPGEWIYEKVAFRSLAMPSGGSCAPNLKPIYRVYNDRAAQRDANHRFTPDAAVRDQMVARGWKDEGVAFCTTTWFLSPMKKYEVSAKAIRTVAECERQAGPCVAVKQLPPMPYLIYGFLPPFYVNKNPDYPYGTEPLTGLFLDVWTSQSPMNVASHSYVQMYSTGGPPYGVHIVGSDRLAGPYAAVSPMYQLPGTAGTGGVDERLFPFRGPRHRTLVFLMDLSVPTIRQLDSSSHAYGGLVIQFGDAASGRSFLATVQAYGTLPPGDFVARDADSGLPIVSTVFRPAALFGTSLGDSFKACTSGAACTGTTASFRFRLYDAEFAKLLERARELDGGLGADPASYFVAQFRAQNETYGNAELGAAVRYLGMDVWY